MMKKLIVMLLCLPLFCNGQTSDRTLLRHAHGEDVVDAVIEKIRSKCILNNDKNLLRRIAAVETDFGKNSSPNTGGIWKVTDVIINFTKTSCQGALRSICNDIIQAFSFDITTATMSQMEVPLYSGIVMDAYITSLNKSVPASISNQAEFWIKYIRPIGKKDDFIEKSEIKFAFIGCSAAKMDLVFAIDASGSVGLYDFNKTLTFLQRVVRDLKIAPNLVRVAVIRFDDDANISFNLNTFNSVNDIINKISGIQYTGQSTNTASAIDLARTAIFKKARKDVPKVFVLITDGKSNDQNQTIAAAERLKNDNITVFTIGIGYVNGYEMLAVASPPSCTHYYSLDSYDEIHDIVREIQRESCTASAEACNTSNNTLPSDTGTKIQNIVFEPSKTSDNKCNPGNTKVVKVEVVCGIVEMYASHDFKKPNAAVHTYMAIAKEGKPGLIRFPANKKLYLSLVSRVDLSKPGCVNPHYNTSFSTPGEVTIICREDGVDRPCTSNDIKHVLDPQCDDENIPNPCTKTNILNNKMRFKHPKSPNKYIQCKLSGQMEIVECPKGTKYNEIQSECGPQVISPPSNCSSINGKNPCTKQAIMNRQFYFANPSDISSFIQCNEWGTAFLVQCPAETAWSQQAYTCVHHSSTAFPTINPCRSSNKNHPSYYENPDDRKSFIQCDQTDNPYIVPCPIGTVWVQSQLTCIHDSIQLGLNMNLNSNPPNSHPTIPKTPTQCTFGEYFPHNDSHKYYVCQWNGVLTEMPCPRGLVWSQTSKFCIWPSGSA